MQEQIREHDVTTLLKPRQRFKDIRLDSLNLPTELFERSASAGRQEVLTVNEESVTAFPAGTELSGDTKKKGSIACAQLNKSTRSWMRAPLFQRPCDFRGITHPPINALKVSS